MHEQAIITLSDLDILENSSGLSARSTLYPALNLLSSNEAGFLQREFFLLDNFNSNSQSLDFYKTKNLIAEIEGRDWAEWVGIP